MRILVSGLGGAMGREVAKLALAGYRGAELVGGVSLFECDDINVPCPTTFEGAVTELQMQTFLLMADFRQRINKQGQPYGWHVAAIMTPETKWGYEHINSIHRTPEESKERILGHLEKYFPGQTQPLTKLITGRKG